MKSLGRAINRLRGGAVASIFSLAYAGTALVTPLALWSAVDLIANSMDAAGRQRDLLWIILAIIPPIPMRWMATFLKPMVDDYFDFHKILLISDEELKRQAEKGKKFIFCHVPHGVIPFCDIAAWIDADLPELRTIPHAVASVLLYLPIVKFFLGIFGLMDASSKAFVRHLKSERKQLSSSIVLWVGGMGELFLAGKREETLYVKHHKGFIKHALRLKDVDIIPEYYFGNTEALTLIDFFNLGRLSQRIQFSVCWGYGVWGLPIPRPTQLLYVRGKPMNLPPPIADPTDDDVNKWHERYCEAVKKLYYDNRDKLEHYKNKELVFA